MCGICGVYLSSARAAVSEETITRMCNVMRHRGPDDEGRHVAGPVGIGMRRLSIIDVAAGHQPIPNEDETLHIVFNGEIYNHGALRKELESRGHSYRTRTDTETILHLYEEVGEQCVTRLRGMFAFAILDERQGKLFLAVDRLGKKPLYYAVLPDRFVFGSECNVVRAEGSTSNAIDADALADYLAFLYVPPPETIFRDIRKLPPAHTLTYQNGEVRVSRYWQLRFAPDWTRTLDEWLESTREKLLEAVQIRLMSEVPLGALLSGGIDSSAIVALMSRASDSVETFSVGCAPSENDPYNELPLSRIVAENFGTVHHELHAHDMSIERDLPRLMWHFGEPFASSTIIPLSVICRLCREFVTVVLAGQGGDEAFAGYPRHLGMRALGSYLRLPKSLRTEVIAPLARLLGGGYETYGWRRRLQRFAATSSDSPVEAYWQWARTASEEDCRKLLVSPPDGPGPDSWAVRWRRLPPGYEKLELENQAFFLDIETYLPFELLTYSDRVSMASSLELRAPFCDHELLEFAATIPPGLKLRRRQLKWLLRETVRETLPPEILAHGKRGFSIRLDDWMSAKEAPLRDCALSREVTESIGLIRPDEVSRLLKDHLSGRRQATRMLWAIISLHVWHKVCIENQLTGPPSITVQELFA